MGYFSNGSEGECFVAAYCDHCIHRPATPDAPYCPIWTAHLLYSSEQLVNGETGKSPLSVVLSLLIPEDERGHNEQCAMFVRGDAVDG